MAVKNTTAGSWQTTQPVTQAVAWRRFLSRHSLLGPSRNFALSVIAPFLLLLLCCFYGTIPEQAGLHTPGCGWGGLPTVTLV